MQIRTSRAYVKRKRLNRIRYITIPDGFSTWAGFNLDFLVFAVDCAAGGEIMATAVASAEAGARRWRLRLPERLPDLKGKWLTLYTIIWAIMLPLSIVGAGRGAYLILTKPTMWSPYGFGTDETSDGLYVRAVFSDAAKATRLEAGDYVVAIDGWPVPRTAARSAARPRVIKPDGSWTTFTVRKPSGERFEVRLVRSQAIEHQRFREAGVSFPLARFFAFAGALLIPAFFIPAGVLLFLRRRREAVPACLSLSFLTFSSISNGGDQLGIGIGPVDVLATAGTLLLFTALFAFPAGRFEPRWTAIPFLLLFPFAFVDWPLVGLGFQILAIAALISRYRKVAAAPERLQLRWAFLGLVIAMLLFTLSLVVDWAAGAWAADDPRWLAWQYAFSGPLTTLGACAMALGLIVSILRYRLYDADAVIGRSAAYGALTLGFIAMFAASQKIIELLGEEYLGQNIGALAGGIGAALAAVAIAPMHVRAQRWAERRFQNSLYRLRKGLPSLVGDLRETSGVEQIAGATLDGLIGGVQSSRAAMLANDHLVDARRIPAEEVQAWLHRWTPPEHDGIDIDRSDCVFPVRVPLEAEGHGRVGWLLLGGRPDGSLFGNSECDVIEEIAEPVARAVQVAIARREREEQYETRFEKLERQLDMISKRLGDSAQHQPRAQRPSKS